MLRTKGIFSWFCAFLATVFVGVSYAATAPNPRATESESAPRQVKTDTQSRRATASPTRIRIIGPTRVNANGGRSATTLTAVRVDSQNARANSSTRSAVPTARARSAKSGITNARAGAKVASGPKGVARSATARATAVYSDLSKIGGGYAECRESYATCMDQMCANANETYRRCFCSDRFTKFRDIENSLDQAMIMLQQFQDNNLNVVDKTAAEVEAMYSPTVGELAIKKDTSAAAKALDAINDLLSGKSSSSYSSSSGSLGILDLDFTTDFDDIWSSDASSIFSSSGTDMSTLEGTALFNAAQNQCVRLTQNNCSSDAMFSMSRSSYNILITQDCNIYEKNLNKKRETVAQAVRTAEKYLREARLEEYRSHNSADVNECIAKVREAILADTACGANYKRCLDPTGAYINGATGEPIYSPRLFKLDETITLSGDVSGDVLQQNPSYDKYLENYRKYVTRELDTCRDIADFVWTEFKRNAIIEIAQSQSAKIEEVKSSCVDTMAECYDTQTNALKNFDKNTATTAAALGRYTARDMCREKVATCAALYSSENCKFDNRGNLTNAGSCGLTSLLSYVETVDSLNVVEKCETALQEYVTKLCTPDNTTYSYPYNCRSMTFSGSGTTNLRETLENFALQNCRDPLKTGEITTYTELGNQMPQIRVQIDSLIAGVRDALSSSLAEVCNDLGGMWAPQAEPNSTYLQSFYNTAFGGYLPDNTSGRPAGKEYGLCYENSAYLACQEYERLGEEKDKKFAEWNEATQTCVLYDGWYEYKCAELGTGYYMEGVCYIVAN